MPNLTYPAPGSGGGSGSPSDGSPTITAGNPSARQYDAKTLAPVQLPAITVTGEGTLTATITLVTGSGGFSVDKDGSYSTQFMAVGDADNVNSQLSELWYKPEAGEQNDVLYSAEVSDAQNREADAGTLKVVNSNLYTEGKKASTTVTIGGTAGSIKLLANGDAISAAVSWAGSLDATVTALTKAVNDFSGTPKFAATKVGSNQIKLEAPLKWGGDVNGMKITATVTGTMTINADAKLAGGVKQVEPELDIWGKAAKLAKEVLPTALGAVATNLILRNMSKVQVEVTVESEDETPDVAVLSDMMEFKLPAGYTPAKMDDAGNWTAAVYPADGVWDFATFKEEDEWCANPALFFLALLKAKRWGAGNALPHEEEEMRRVYEQCWDAAKRCDEMVRSGYKDTNGNAVMEPRYSIHTLINGMARKDALEAVASVCDAMVVYGDDGGIHYKMDKPDVAKRLVTNKNVGAGEFKYTGGSLNAMYNWVDVEFNNPSKKYHKDTVFAYDLESMQRFGEKKTKVLAFGCCSEGQAKRKARYIMLNEKSNPLVVSYVASWDHHDLVKGDLVAVVNNNNLPSGVLQKGGRIQQVVNTSTVILDRSITVYDQGHLHVTMSDGRIETRKVTSVVTSGDFSTATLESPLTELPEKNAVWVYYGPNLAPVTFKIIAKTERQMGIWEISAVAYDPTKYALMDEI